MTKLMGVAKKSDAAETMWTNVNVRLSKRGLLEHLEGLQALPIKQDRPDQKHRIKELRQAGNAREPSQSSDNEGKNHGERSDNVFMCSITRK
jgi:hypothetical protein